MSIRPSPFSQQSIAQQLGYAVGNQFNPHKTAAENAGESIFGDADGNSVFYDNASKPDEPTEKNPGEMQECTISARVLEGNPGLVTKSGGLSGDTVGDFFVTPGSAAVDPA